MRCNTAWNSESVSELVATAIDHGASAHGFTPVWYSAERIAKITEAIHGRWVTRPGRWKVNREQPDDDAIMVLLQAHPSTHQTDQRPCVHL